MTKKEKLVPYVCGLPECNKRIAMPNRGELLKLPHRDIHGFMCNGMMVRYDLTEEGKRVMHHRMWQRQMDKQRRRMRRPG